MEIVDSTDIGSAINIGDVPDLAEVWRLYDRRAVLAHAIERARQDDRDDDAATFRAVLEALPEVTPLQALQASQRLVDLLTGSRWRVIQDARKQKPPATWDRIGDALGMSRQSAWELFQRGMAEFRQDITAADTAPDPQ